MKPIIPTFSKNELILGDDAVIEEPKADEKEDKLKHITIDELPKSLFSHSLKDIDGYRELRKSKKIELLKKEFVDEMSKIMTLFEREDKKYDSQLVKFVCQLAEHYFILYPHEMGTVKERAVIEVVKRFYNYDERLVITIIQLVLPLIKKTNVLRRCQSKLQRLFFLFLNYLVSK